MQRIVNKCVGVKARLTALISHYNLVSHRIQEGFSTSLGFRSFKLRKYENEPSFIFYFLSIVIINYFS